jgi:hypothetical protein
MPNVVDIVIMGTARSSAKPRSGVKGGLRLYAVRRSFP